MRDVSRLGIGNGIQGACPEGEENMSFMVTCCGKLITHMTEGGVGIYRIDDCLAFMSDGNPETEAVRREICQRLFDSDAICPEIAPYCEQFKDELARERARKRDEEERRAAGAWPPKERSEDSVWDTLHTALDGLGLIPGIGIAPDAVNAGIYSIEGDWLNAGISMAGMVEGIGQGATGTRLAVKVSRKAVIDLGKEGIAKAFQKAVTRGKKEEVLRVGYHWLAGRVDSYKKLGKETQAWNKGMREIYPRHGNPDLRLDAHHAYEARAYKKFKDDFAAIGIKSEEDMLTVAIPYEAHIRSPEGLESLFVDRIARNVDEGAPIPQTFSDEAASSLTEELKHAIKLDSLDTVEDVIEAYEQYYQRSPIWWDKFKPVFEELRTRFGMPPL